jgi:hypothetical protein
MGLFDLFSKEGREKSALERNIKIVTHKYRQSPERIGAMERLRDMCTDDSLYGLARRFSFVYDKTIEDEQEKEFAEQIFVGLGEKSIAPLKRYLLDADTISWPLRILAKIATPEQILDVVDAVLAKESPGYTRDPSKKVQILSWLDEQQIASAAEISKRVVPYLKDFDENVRFTSVNTLVHHPDEASAKAPLLDALLRKEEESKRLKVRIAEVLAEMAWTVTERKAEVSEILPPLGDWGMQHDKLVSGKKSK